MEAFSEYAFASKELRRILIPSGTSCLRKAGFSAVAAIKTGSLEGVERKMHLALPNVAPRFDVLCYNMQGNELQ